jgi:hypothetical protein
MDNLSIKKTQNTLEVNFNSGSGVCRLTGSSYPENSIKFFKPLIDWIKEYGEKGKGGITLELRVTYINTSSTKCILDIFELLEAFHKKRGNIKIKWYYLKNEDDLRETGEELTEHINIPVDFIAYEG